MIYYHGTIKQFLPSILKNGLEVQPNNRWQMNVNFSVDFGFGEMPLKTFDPANEEAGDRSIYLNADKTIARGYGRSKAVYFRTVPGKNFKFKTAHDGVWEARKSFRAPYIPNASLIVLTVSLPDDWPLEIDPKDNTSMLTTKPIPPRYIKEK